MKYRCKNLTYQPIRLMIGISQIRVPPRKTIVFDEYNDQMKEIEGRGLIKVRQIK